MSLPTWDDTQPTQPEAVPDSNTEPQKQVESLPTWDETEDVQDKYGTVGQQAKTAIEQGLSGATLGLSKVAETKLGIATPEDIKLREDTNPVTSTVSNIGGTIAGLSGPDEVLGPLKGVQLLSKGIEGALGAGKLARIAGGAGAGAIIGGVNQVTDDWSQDKALDANKIIASAKFGALLGGGGTALFEGASKLPLVGKASKKLWTGASDATPIVPEGEPLVSNTETTPIVDAPSGKTGVQPTSLSEMAERVKSYKQENPEAGLPEKAVLEDAINRVPMDNPVNPAQMQSLTDQNFRDTYNTLKETPGPHADSINGYEAIQKAELLDKTEQAIQDVAPDSTPEHDPIKAGENANDAFKDVYQTEKTALDPILKQMGNINIEGSVLTGSINKMIDALPDLQKAFDTTGADITLKPYETSWGIDQSTYNAAKEAIESLKKSPSDFESVWNIRKGLNQRIPPMDSGQGANQIRALAKGLLDYMQGVAENSDPELNARDALKRYAINEQNREVIEHEFGASVGKPERGSISKVVPEQITKNIFKNSSSVEAAKNILPKEQFNSILQDYLSEAKYKVTDKGSFSSNKWGSFLKANKSSLDTALSDKPEQLQRLNDLTNIMRLLPDAPKMNPSGTAKTLLRAAGGLFGHGMTWEDMLLLVPKQAAKKIGEELQASQLNKVLAGKSSQNSLTQKLMQNVKDTSDKLSKGARLIFTGSSSQSRKENE